MEDWILFLLRADSSDSYELEMMLSVMPDSELKCMRDFVKTQRKYRWAVKYVNKELSKRLIV